MKLAIIIIKEQNDTKTSMSSIQQFGDEDFTDKELHEYLKKLWV